MRSLARRLIVEEHHANNGAVTGSRVAFRVCEKLRRPLATFAGVAGFRSLLSRALALARVEVPLLSGVQIRPDGSFQFAPELEAQLDTDRAAEAAAILVEQLLALLIVFIGEALTLRLVHDVWPQAALRDSKSGGK